MSANWMLRAACSAAMMLALMQAAHASAARTFVSGVGDDANTATNCPRTTPCRHLANAFTVTVAGGEIVMLDAAGYGPLNITSSLTLSGTDGAAIAVAAGTIGLTINPGASGNVVIHKLQVTGTNAANSTGIQVNSGRLVLADSSLKLLTTALSVNSSKVFLDHVEIAGNGTGISATGTGVDLGTFPQTGPTWVVLHYGTVLNNTTAFVMNNPGSTQDSIFATTLGSTMSPFIAGNTNMMTGTGASCSGRCNFLNTILQQQGTNLQ